MLDARDDEELADAEEAVAELLSFDVAEVTDVVVMVCVELSVCIVVLGV